MHSEERSGSVFFALVTRACIRYQTSSYVIWPAAARLLLSQACSALGSPAHGCCPPAALQACSALGSLAHGATVAFGRSAVLCMQHHVQRMQLL